MDLRVNGDDLISKFAVCWKTYLVTYTVTPHMTHTCT